MKRAIYIVLLVIFIAIFLVSGYFLLEYLLDSKEQKALYGDLAQMVSEAREAAQQAQPTSTAPVNDGAAPSEPAAEPVTELVTVVDPETGAEVEILPEYADLYLMNTDLVGWIQVDGTNIDYPVTQTPEQSDYYLRTSFQKEYNRHGCIYVQGQCDVNRPSDNLIIYGHCMQDGTMFAELHNFIDQDFWEEHGTFTFDTLTERHTYQIIAVFKTSANLGQGFLYNQFIDAENEAAFDQFVATCKSLAYYDTGLTAEYGDKLICLSTCEYTLNNGRLVVLAKRIS